MRGLKLMAGCAVVAVLIVLGGCGKGAGKAEAGFPDKFETLPDTAQVAYVISHATPDSVARFICASALGQVEGAKIDSLGIATNYAYEHFNGDDAESFSVAYDSFVGALPLPDKMRMYALAGVEDPQGLGLQLGLEYMQSIRDRNMTPAEVDREIEAFRTACGDDQDLYDRFLTGFRTVLKVDEGRDIPKEITEKYGN
ncbi:MAG: hypothetical protein K2K97_04565 [Muribaculaceae bacterium]|nr:hypothetical protein [Muribaculaceae bacterium]